MLGVLLAALAMAALSWLVTPKGRWSNLPRPMHPARPLPTERRMPVGSCQVLCLGKEY